MTCESYIEIKGHNDIYNIIVYKLSLIELLVVFLKNKNNTMKHCIILMLFWRIVKKYLSPDHSITATTLAEIDCILYTFSFDIKTSALVIKKNNQNV